MTNTVNFHVLKVYDRDEDRITYERIKNDNGGLLFCVSDLCECPEDAIIGRDLFDADDYIAAVRFGMSLARDGYNDIHIITTTRGAEDESE